MYPSADLTFDGEATPGATGFFEVTIVDTNELVHSKKNGDGHVDSQEKLDRILRAVGNAIQASTS